jgi:hypothetical protein
MKSCAQHKTIGKLHSGLLNQRRDVAMHVILENELQGINAAQAVIHEYVATPEASSEISIEKW